MRVKRNRLTVYFSSWGETKSGSNHSLQFQKLSYTLNTWSKTVYSLLTKPFLAHSLTTLHNY